jgi:hypothetical protein
MIIEGHISRLGNGGYRVLLDFSTGGALRQRQIEHDDCEKLTEAAALVMAMAIDPERMRLGASELPPPAPPPPSAPPREAEPLPPAESRAIAWSVALMGSGQAGALPEVGPGIGGQIGLDPLPSFRLEVAGSYWFPTSQPLAGGANAELWMWSAGLRGCWVRGSRWELVLCGGPEIGQVTGRGQRVEAAATATDWWGALLFGIRGGYHPSRPLELLLGIEAGASVVRPRYGVEGVGEVFRPAPWLVRAGAGLGFEFP